ncbi:MAG: hypothetical protein R2688_06260 [Fimbriimonadaceae bacterium]
MFEELEDRSAQDIPRIEPRPTWRLSGIVISEGVVMALLDRGSSVDLIRSGSPVPGTEWVCVATILREQFATTAMFSRT